MYYVQPLPAGRTVQRSDSYIKCRSVCHYTTWGYTIAMFSTLCHTISTAVHREQARRVRTKQGKHDDGCTQWKAVD